MTLGASGMAGNLGRAATSNPSAVPLVSSVHLDPLVKREAEELQRLGSGLAMYTRSRLGLGGWGQTGSGVMLSQQALAHGQMGFAGGLVRRAVPPNRDDEFRDDQGDAERAAQQQQEQQQEQQAAAQTAKWTQWMAAAWEETRGGLNEWISSARILTGIVMGRELTVVPGGLYSPVPFHGRIIDRLNREGMPYDWATGFGQTVYRAWTDWATGWSLVADVMPPSFGFFSAPAVPPMIVDPFALSLGRSSQESALYAEGLQAQLAQGVKEGASQAGARQMIMDYASKLISRARLWRGMAQVTNVVGWGPVPSYAPPTLFGGPVVGGCAVSLPFGRTLTGDVM